MAESESGQDKTEDPTEKKKKDAREKGEIARSKELNTLAIMLAGPVRCWSSEGPWRRT